MFLEPVGDVGGLFRLASPINQDRQVTADANRIHVVEEKEPIAAEQILNVVFRRDDQEVDSGVVEESVEPGGVEGERLSNS